ncbi:hypothetical protein F441_20821 [Phytophthora nicotianae CJ01A1]|uniref:HAT C-terminal dimerisation domain-containing protein n=3 Tax=Phytophthora nicotianae TaxID=4792 RepID=W2PIY4_PHYN3|nr:hypothetical protein PPTG_18203 [Phytophthora nicotianae INRA-310]ETI32158.1 hypothetical protein F443_20959 [Phytophthora nicotianae P1569]ETN00199.1 hypothetical protein PPTG_18203 [Phytophthora nicotianae INRA-310]ETP02016.1 hypothetical protein F441_20821 [Phytophthora nicotianae CJ01A1]
MSQTSDLEKFEGVMKELQKSTLLLSAVRRLFDQVVKKFPALKTRLASTAPIVSNPILEQGIFKIQRREALTSAESGIQENDGTKRSYFGEVAYIPPTSNECERFFSGAKLLYNRKLWDVNTVEQVRARIGTN